MKSIILTTLALAFLVIACKNDGSSSIEQELKEKIELYNDSVMVVHDRTMPQMSKIEDLRKQLTEQRKALIGVDNFNEVKKVNNLLGELNKSENAMWDWMYNFKPDTLQNDEKVNYLREELRSVRKMENIVISGIAKAESYIQK
ncbi:hypothetical protein [Membranihabitans marinus]|uniref:hypothetical protein n=1 Tax=Membranihabitans marinus TaxID=1227546 RepID=UPI001F2B165D|nr:hypothetical protein [Membranihabitans marinus]